MAAQGFKCKHCLKNFGMNETVFLKHSCKEMQRSELLETMAGKRAYGLYGEWMRRNKYSIPDIETFASSRYFTTFIKLVAFLDQYNIDRPDKFIELMVQKKISPQLFCRDECYMLYINWYDRFCSPYEQAQITVDTLVKLAELRGTKVQQVFDVIHDREIGEFLRHRKMTPWILLCSNKFLDKYDNMDPDDQRQLGNLMGISYWHSRMAENPSIVSDMKKAAEMIGI